MKRLALVLPLAALIAAPAGAATLVRLDGIGPLKLGMERMAALDTGWLGDRSPGCPLGGPPLPITYRFSGPQAPAGIHGSAEFSRHRLRVLTFRSGVRTAKGVVPGRTAWAAMVKRYRHAGYRVSARYVDTFQGRFVTVKRRKAGRQILGAFARGRVIDVLGVPYVPTCE